MTAGSLGAEWLKLWRRPATWVLGLLLLSGLFTLGYAFLYLVVLLFERLPASPESPDPAATAAALRVGLLPAGLVGQVLPQVAGIGGPLALVLGGLALGGEYSWGTLKTIFTQAPGRLTIFAGKLLALALLLLLLNLGAFAVGLAGSLLVAALERAPIALPPAATIARGLAAAWLILAAWTALGVLLAALFRGTALALGLGLVYSQGVEAAAGGIALLVDRARPVYQIFLGANTGALANSFRAPDPFTAAFAAPPSIGALQAAVVTCAYTAAFLVAAALLLRRRDVP